MSAGIKANVDGSAAIQVGGTDVITLTSGGAATFVTSPTTVQAGTAAAPSITTSGDTNTGIFFPAADTIAFAEGGVESARFDSAGNFGLGVTPSAWSTANSIRAFQIGPSGVGSFWNYNNYAAFVGCGYYWNGTNRIYLTTGNPVSEYSQNSGVHQWLTAPSGTAGNAITFTQAMTLDASGNLGIGTSSPSHLLQATKNQNATTRIAVTNSDTTNTSSRAAFQATSGTVNCDLTAIQSLGAYLGTSSNHDLNFVTNGNTRVTVTSDGNFLVGSTTLQTGNFDFTRTSGDSVLAVNRTGTLSNSQSSVLYAIGNKGSANVRQAAVFVFKHSSITNPCGALNLQCEDAAQNYLWADNSDVFRISTDPNNIGTTGGTVVGTQTSDERLKNISGAISYGLTEVMALQPISFAMKDDPQTAKIGFSAQQVQPIIPESVYDTGECIDGYDVDPENKLITTPKSDRTKLAMEYTQLIPVLVKALQEQQAMIDELKAKVAALEGASQ